MSPHFVAMIEWLEIPHIRTDAPAIYHSTEGIDICKGICRNKSNALGCHAINYHASLGCNLIGDNLTSVGVRFWSNMDWGIHFVACVFGELGYPGQ